VVAATNIPLSHAAIYDAHREQVIEAVGKGIGQRSLDSFVNLTHRVLVIRPRWWSPASGAAAVTWARGKIGKKYDFLGVVGLGSSRRWYCTELCLSAYDDSHTKKDHLPRVMEPGQMYLWGTILFDSGPRN
jgi:uncharacterized protein YycO